MSAERLAACARLAIALAVVAILVVFVHGVEWSDLAAAFMHASIWPVAIAAALHFAMQTCKAACWRILLAPRHRVPFPRLVGYTLVAVAASALAPLRAGELARVWLLKHRDHVPVRDAATVAICEKILDGAAMFALALPAVWVVPGLPARVAEVAGAGAAMISVLAVAIVVVARLDATRWSSPRLTRLACSLRSIGDGRRLLAAFGALVAGWLIDLAMLELVLVAFGLWLTPAAAVVVLLAINVAISVPTTPAQIGVHEAGALVGLSLVHVPAVPALAVALVYHMVQIIPVVAASLALEWRLVLGRSS